MLDQEDNSITGEVLFNRIQNHETDDNVHKYVGKVRDMYTFDDYGLVVFDHSDRLSCYDTNICNVEGKGNLLNSLSTWWLNQTRHIIDNHHLYSQGRFLVAKKCKRIDIEVIVRGYITGSSPTSLWTLYKDGKHNVYSVNLPDGLVKNQRLPEVVITPTTKGETDKPLRDEEVIASGLLSSSEWDYIKSVALRLFEYGSMVAERNGLILVDTKYEFGYDSTGNIILIDEIHTGDSSRYWKINSYSERLSNNLEPENFDKDHIRRYVSANYPQIKGMNLQERSAINFEIPDTEISNVFTAYHDLSTMLVGSQCTRGNASSVSMCDFLTRYVNDVCPLVICIAGSRSDMEAVSKVNKQLDSVGIMYHNFYHSAHKETNLVMSIINKYNNYTGRKIAYVAVVGMSNALGGVVSANTRYPVINCPNFKDKDDMMVNVNSSLQMPSRVPSAVILRPDNVSLFVRNLFNL